MLKRISLPNITWIIRIEIQRNKWMEELPNSHIKLTWVVQTSTKYIWEWPPCR